MASVHTEILHFFILIFDVTSLRPGNCLKLLPLQPPVSAHELGNGHGFFAFGLNAQNTEKPAARARLHDILASLVQHSRVSLSGNHLGRDNLNHLVAKEAIGARPGRKAPHPVMNLDSGERPIDKTVFLFQKRR